MVRPNASSRPNSNPASASRRDVYAEVTAKIIAAIESGPGGWTLPWRRSGVAITRPTNVASGRPYRGVNTVSLWAAAEVSHYASGVWGTFNQWRSIGANVRKGERSSLAVLWKDLTKSTDASDASADEEGRRRVFARGFAVFNRDQVDGYDTTPAVILPEDQRLAAAELFLAHLEIAARFDAGNAYYHIASDTVFMPPFASFKDAHGFYATHLHECAHATGAKHRLDRDFSGRYAKEAVAMEELVAELTSAFLLADLGIAHDPRPDHSS